MTGDKLTIRKAFLDDFDAIEALWNKVIQDAFAKQGSDQYHNPSDELAFKMGQLNAAFHKENAHYFLAFVKSKLVGTIAYGTPPNKGILRRTKNALIDCVEIGSLYIDPALQRHGYGKQLLYYILDNLLKQGVDTVCFDSVIESSKQIWQRVFGEPKYAIPSKKHDFVHMIWVVNVKASIERLKK